MQHQHDIMEGEEPSVWRENASLEYKSDSPPPSRIFTSEGVSEASRCAPQVALSPEPARCRLPLAEKPSAVRADDRATSRVHNCAEVSVISGIRVTKRPPSVEVSSSPASRSLPPAEKPFAVRADGRASSQVHDCAEVPAISAIWVEHSPPVKAAPAPAPAPRYLPLAEKPFAARSNDRASSQVHHSAEVPAIYAIRVKPSPPVNASPSPSPRYLPPVERPFAARTNNRASSQAHHSAEVPAISAIRVKPSPPVNASPATASRRLPHAERLFTVRTDDRAAPPCRAAPPVQSYCVQVSPAQYNFPVSHSPVSRYVEVAQPQYRPPVSQSPVSPCINQQRQSPAAHPMSSGTGDRAGTPVHNCVEVSQIPTIQMVVAVSQPKVGTPYYVHVLYPLNLIHS